MAFPNGEKLVTGKLLIIVTLVIVLHSFGAFDVMVKRDVVFMQYDIWR